MTTGKSLKSISIDRKHLLLRLRDCACALLEYFVCNNRVSKFYCLNGSSNQSSVNLSILATSSTTYQLSYDTDIDNLATPPLDIRDYPAFDILANFREAKVETEYQLLYTVLMNKFTTGSACAYDSCVCDFWLTEATLTESVTTFAVLSATAEPLVR